MATRTPFATVTELQAFWKDLTTDEQTRATSLLGLSSDRLRLQATSHGVDLDAKAALDDVFKSVLKSVVMESVKRAMLTPTDLPPVSDYSQQAGVYSENFKYVNPAGDLWFKKSELKSIGIAIQRLTNFSTSRTDIYGDFDS